MTGRRCRRQARPCTVRDAEMNACAKTLIIALPFALLLSAALRFIQHTEREYAMWLDLIGPSAELLAQRCKETETAAICAAARQRQALAAEFRDYHDSVMRWWWPMLAAALAAWAATVVSIACLARRRLRRRTD
jgi:hypothetical protein